jgi:hypothetical protein
MKTIAVSEAKPQLAKLVQQVQRGAPVILVQGDKLAKLERYELLDPEFDGPELEAMLLDAVRGPHAPYSQKEMRSILDNVVSRITCSGPQAGPGIEGCASGCRE